jgi:hypothetical protein
LPVLTVSSVVPREWQIRLDDPRNARLSAILFCVFGALIAWRLLQQAVLGTADGRLIVRNVVRSRTRARR